MHSPNPAPVTQPLNQSDAQRRARVLAQRAPWFLAGAGLSLAIAFAALHRAPCDAAVASAYVPVPTDRGDRVLAGPHVLVGGMATVEVIPDTADVSITLGVETLQPRDAVRGVKEQRDALEQALRGESLEALRLGAINLHPVYETTGDRSTVRAYAAAVTLVASTRDFERVGAIFERAAEFSVTHMSTGFRSTALPEKKHELRAKALEAARAKAEQSAEVLGVTLGPVISIEEQRANQGAGWGAVGNFVSNEYAAAGAPSDVALPGAVTMSLSVEVGFAIS